MRTITKRTAAFLLTLLLALGLLPVLPAEKAQAASWKNLTIGQFDTVYKYSGSEEVTYQLTLPSSGTIRQALSSTSGETDFYLYNAEGQRITSWSGKGNNTYTEECTLVGGIYYIEADGWYSNNDCSFSWFFEPANESFQETQDDRNNDLSSAFPINIGNTVNGQFALNDDSDYYTFTSTKRGALSLKLTNKMAYMNVSVVNTEGTFNYNEKEIDKGTKTLTLQLPAGTYYLVCTRYSDSYTGNYSFTTSFANAPSKTKLTSAKNVKSGKLKATWKKVSSVSGYEVQISQYSSFDSSVTTKNVGASKTTYTFKGLSVDSYSPDKYYCRVRAYKTVNGIKAYSAWSNIKGVTIKK